MMLTTATSTEVKLCGEKSVADVRDKCLHVQPSLNFYNKTAVEILLHWCKHKTKGVARA